MFVIDMTVCISLGTTWNCVKTVQFGKDMADQIRF